MWNHQLTPNRGDLPPFYAVLDLETCNPPAEEIEIEKRYAATGHLKDPAKIAAKKDGLKLATTDSAPIWCAGLKTKTGFLSLSQAVLTADERRALTCLGWQVMTFSSEFDLLTMYAIQLSFLPENSRLIAAGDFDLHKSKFRFARHALPIPPQLFLFKYTDLMRKWQDVTLSDKLYVSVEEMCLKLAIHFENGLTGAEIPEAIQAGRHFEVLMKNYKDCLHEEQIAHRLLTGKL